MILDDLRVIWEHALLNELGLTLSAEHRDFSQYVVLLVIPDLFDRQEVRELFRMLVCEMGFAAVMVLQVFATQSLPGSLPTLLSHSFLAPGGQPCFSFRNPCAQHSAMGLDQGAL